MKADPTTKELILAAQRRDQDAFERLVERYRERLLHQIEARMGRELRSRMEPEDVLQETLLRAFKVIEKFRWQGDESFYRWLGTIAEHIIRKAANRKTLGYLQIDDDVADGGASPATEHRRQERYERLEEALRSLSPEHREVIRLARLEGLKSKDIAVRMQRSEDAVHKLLARALLKLRDSFGDTESLGLPRDRFMGGGDDTAEHSKGDEHREEHQ